jgi:hypothetical protein
MSNSESSYEWPATDSRSFEEKLDYIIERILPNNYQMAGLLVLGNVIPWYLRGAVYTENQHSFNLWVGGYMVCYYLFHRYNLNKPHTAPELT